VSLDLRLNMDFSELGLDQGVAASTGSLTAASTGVDSLTVAAAAGGLTAASTGSNLSDLGSNELRLASTGC
jgi:hypothetical protein